MAEYPKDRKKESEAAQSCPDSLRPPWAVGQQAPLSMGFPRQEYRSGLPFPAPGDLPDPGIEPTSLKSPALADEFFTTVPLGKLMFTYCLPKRARLFESHSPRFHLASNVVMG